jgi:hypothetical protein
MPKLAFRVRLGRASATCRRCEQAKERAHYAKNRLTILARKKELRDQDLSAVARVRRSYYLKNRTKLNAKATERNRANPIRRIRASFRSRFHKVLSAKGLKKIISWQKLVGYSVHDLRRHIEVQLPSEFGWHNYGIAWHIDHLKPVASFELPDQIRECWALSNLRPLAKMANHRKGSRNE